MKVFLSWSGERSRLVAVALRQWLPDVVSFFDPWLSSEDVDKGARWVVDLNKQLEGTDTGIICLTPENKNAQWIQFEAGAISTAIDKSRVCTYLFDLAPSDLEGPLVQFQATLATRDDTFRLLQSLNRRLGGKARSDGQLERLFTHWWPSLDAALRSVEETGDPVPRRKEREILEELLDISRQHLKREMASPIVDALIEFGLLNLFGGQDVSRFQERVKLTGSADDPNATSWHDSQGHPLRQSGQDVPLCGLWSSRWNDRKSPFDGWTTGIAAAAFCGQHFALLHKDAEYEFVLLGERYGDRLAGREYRLGSLKDIGPWAGLVVSENRIDGEWERGRWDFRR